MTMQPAFSIRAATAPRRSTRMLVVDPRTATVADRRLADLAGLVGPGDLVVLNDAATLPVSLHTEVRGRAIELRLAGRTPEGGWTAAVYGEGGWRDATEARQPPPQLEPGDRFDWPGLTLHVERTDPTTPRLVWVRLEAPQDRWVAGLHHNASPVQYSYLSAEAPLATFQTAFASRPWAVEAPSAALPLTFEVLLGVRRTGARLATLTHAAGLSSIDGGALDAHLPWPERTDLPASTVEQVHAARRAGGRVIAVGTTVVRALEGRVASAGALLAGDTETTLVLGPDHHPRVVDGLLTKLHDPRESHFQVLAAFAPPSLLIEANATAARAGYLGHEFGDSALILASKQ